MGLGSNTGGPRARIEDALRRLEGILGRLEIAPFYRSAPDSPIPQPDFLNTVALGRTLLPPDTILALGKKLEMEAGRRRGPRLGPRPLDIDLLLYGDRVSDRPELTLPHPRLRERSFALIPLRDLRPDLKIPPDGETVAELAEALDARDLSLAEDPESRRSP